MSTRHETNHMVSWCHFITHYIRQMTRDWFKIRMPSKKKEEVVPVVCNRKWEEAEKIEKISGE